MRYKVGDRVRIKSLDWYNENKDEYGDIKFLIKEMSEFCGEIMTIKRISGIYYIMEESAIAYGWTDEMIEGLVEEEEIEFTEEDKYWCDIMSESDPTTYVLPQGYQFVDENGNVINATKIVLEKKKKEYPKTYCECKDILGLWDIDDTECGYYKTDLIDKLQMLLICRDAYWKIAGEEMGLGKPWEPDWKNHDIKYILFNQEDEIDSVNVSGPRNYILAFPTEEMRDAFKENFDPDIEFCKELL